MLGTSPSSWHHATAPAPGPVCAPSSPVPPLSLALISLRVRALLSSPSSMPVLLRSPTLDPSCARGLQASEPVLRLAVRPRSAALCSEGERASLPQLLLLPAHTPCWLPRLRLLPVPQRLPLRLSRRLLLALPLAALPLRLSCRPLGPGGVRASWHRWRTWGRSLLGSSCAQGRSTCSLRACAHMRGCAVRLRLSRAEHGIAAPG